MTLIIGVSARKGGGKDTLGNIFAGQFYNNLNMADEYWATENVIYHLRSCKVYHFADKLKEFCRDYLGIDPKLLWGTDDDKNTKVPWLLWENMPDYDEYAHDLFRKRKTIPEGPMSAREVMQYFGSNICRKMYKTIWGDACFRQIEKDSPDIALILDVRFPSEANAINGMGGFNVRLTRCPFPEDQHESETALDNYQFDVVVDNANLSKENSIQLFKQKMLELLK